MDRRRIRNFSIIAHIDHGKSTLADRLLELTRTVSERQKRDRLLDNMDIERERGITIKAQAVRLRHTASDGLSYHLNLIDTPGHVDFAYEVSRSLASCDGALLVVDASQGVEAQTLANVYMALENDLEVVPVLNKMDLPHADPERARREIEEVVGLPARDALEVSAKTGRGVDRLLEAIVERVPPPSGDPAGPLQALIFDSWFDAYQGVVVLVRVFGGTIGKKDRVRLKRSGGEYEVLSLAVNAPFFTEVEELAAGEVGMLICGIKAVSQVGIGDTIVHAGKGGAPSLPGYKEVNPMVFCGIFPVEHQQHGDLKEALEKLALNDSSFRHEQENSKALGLGFRCGFLGLLHMSIVQERLEREFGLSLISTAPSCRYRVAMNDGSTMEIDNPTDLPDPSLYRSLEEPLVDVGIHVPDAHVGAIIKLCNERRGRQLDMSYVTADRVHLRYRLPLNEIVFDFYDRLKGLSRGYASMDYELAGYGASDLVRVNVLVNGEPVDVLSMICHRGSSQRKGRELARRLQKTIARQQFDIPVQAAIGSRIIARETVKAVRKNVIAKCYGGDVTRKRKLLEKQKAGKRRMKMVGSVEIPQEAFLAVLRTDG